jgi:intracellular sulfur oxidation DsrE/DsrF family protein
MAKQAMIVVDYEFAAMVHWEVALHNVGLLLDDAVAVFELKPGGVIARLTSGRTVEADLVLLSIGANLVACQMSMDLMGIRREELIDGIQVGGVASYLEASEKADNNLFI